MVHRGNTHAHTHTQTHNSNMHTHARTYTHRFTLTVTDSTLITRTRLPSSGKAQPHVGNYARRWQTELPAKMRTGKNLSQPPKLKVTEDPLTVKTSKTPVMSTIEVIVATSVESYSSAKKQPPQNAEAQSATETECSQIPNRNPRTVLKLNRREFNRRSPQVQLLFKI